MPNSRSNPIDKSFFRPERRVVAAGDSFEGGDRAFLQNLVDLGWRRLSGCWLDVRLGEQNDMGGFHRVHCVANCGVVGKSCKSV